MILLAGEGDPVLPDADDGGDDADAETVAFERPALLDMRLEIPDMAPAFGRGARAAGKTHLVQRFPHGSVAVAIARGVDVIIGDSANVGPAAKERAEMSFFIAPCRNFDGAVDVRVGIDNSGGLKGIHDAERPIEPAGEILAFEMRPGQQFRSGVCAGAEHIADAIDRNREPCLRKPRGKPLQRAHMRLRESRLVNAGFVGTDAAECIKIRQDPSAIGVRTIIGHEPCPC